MEAITFRPIYQERVWGGRELERAYRRSLPSPDRPFGESWEIVDRENEQSVVDRGPLAGTTLHELWNSRREEIFGSGYADAHPRFPILIKILDARDDLSIQVHPPADLAALLGGEPKTEMWYIARCEPGAKLHVGLRQGVTRAMFENAIGDGSVADRVHAITPAPGQSIFIPSGRLHAIGAGFLIHEIQQNSDTTYRVFDWNRSGLEGKPRDLHVRESLASIDYQDFEPEMDRPIHGVLAECPFFRTELIEIPDGHSIGNPTPDRFSILSVVGGSLTGRDATRFDPGSTLLLPNGPADLTASGNAAILRITLPTG